MPENYSLLEPYGPYIIIKIEKEKQREKKEKIGSIFLPIDDKNESHNMQSGEISTIGKDAKTNFPQLEIGQTAILHWMVESKQKDNFIHEDEDYNYYLATTTEYAGRPNEVYGVWDGEKIIPNPEYVFIEIEKTESDIDLNEVNEETGLGVNIPMTQSEGGLFVFKEWKETRTQKEQRMAKINAEIESLTKTKMSSQLAQGIKAKENELAGISADINKTKIEFYKVAAINPDLADELQRSFGHKVDAGDKIGVLNIATQTTVEFMGATFIVSLSKHIHCTFDWCKQGIENFKKIGRPKKRAAV